MKKTERLLAIVLVLKQKGKMTAAELAAFLEVNIRTIYRDIDALSQMGVPLFSISGKKGGYDIRDDYFLPSISFTRDEVLALSIARDLILNTEIPGFDPFIRSAFLKIENITPDDEKKRLSRVTRRILFDLKYIDPPMDGRSYFQIIRKAFEENLCLYISYYSTGRGETVERLVYPWILTYADGVWYLRGKSDDKPFLWWFRLDRIRAVRLADREFSLPENFDKYSLSYGGSSGGSLDVSIRLENSLYETVKEDLLFSGSNAEKEGNSTVLSFQTDRRNAVLEFLFRNGETTRLLGPESLMDEMRKKLNILGKIYL